MKKLNKIFCTNVCLTNRKTIMFISIILLSTLVLAGVLYESENIVEIKDQPPSNEEIWIPTKDDIAYQDSMYNIIQQTQNDVDTIKIQVQMIIERLDYEYDTYDSIRYVKGGIIDNRRNKENQSR